MGRKKLNKEEKKPHLTLHINEALLDRLEEKTDEKRSQLIEKLLKGYLDKKNDQKITNI
jgi:metal-responsive CopG/Arc/MetJ family transcriptional regulator